MSKTINANSQKSIVFIDATVAGYEKLAARVEIGTEVIILDSTKNGIAQITDTLASRSNLSAVHIVSHGITDSLQLGNNFLNSQNINNYAAQLQQWQNALSENADILIYGCNVASEGKNFLQSFAELTGANIAASNDLTGNAALGGDWDLEVQIGEITSPLAFSATTMAEYEGVLNTTVSITAATANAVEGGVNGVYRIQRTNSVGDLKVKLTIDSTSAATVDDYALAIGNNRVTIENNTLTLTIAEGKSFVDLNLNAIDEAVSFAEGNETLKINLAEDTGYQLSDANKAATVTIDANGFLVTNTEDSINEYKPGSLRQAILNANNIAGENIITFDTKGVFGTAQTIALSGDELIISDSLTILGTGANNLTLSGNNASRIFSLIGKNIQNTFDGLTITKGKGIQDLGGGIFVGEGNTLNLTNSTISDNEASIGGGIGNSGVLNLINSTVSGNTAFYGGGIHNTGTINLINSTISGNTADFSGGGIHNDFINNDNIGTATLTNVTIANNSATIGAGLINEKNATFSLANTIVANNNGTNTDLDGNFTDLGNNLIDKSNGNGFTNGVNGSIVGTNDAPIDAKIGILANNGGTTLTHALLINSLAINQGNNALISEEIPKDQRNLQRIIGNKVDIGAVEFVGYSISGKNFEDINNNGELDPNENGLENWTIYADVNNNSILDAGELFTIADAEGNYTLFVEPGTYNIQKLQETGWKQTTPNPNNPNLINITDADVKNINFGNFKLGQVRGKIFNDLNPNGILDQGETGIKDWQIFLDSNDNGLLDETEQSTTTDDNGDYSFTDLIAGIYKVRTVQQNGWKQTSNNPEDVNIISGSNVTEVNFGNFNQPLPEIEVSHQANDVPDNTETFDFGSAIVGSNISQVFTIKNSGNGDLNLSNLSLPTGFKVVGNLPEIITAGKSAELEIQLDTSQAGGFSGTLQFDTNDTDENPYNFTITGAVKAIAVSLTPGTNPSETGVTNGSFNVQLSDPAPEGGLTINFTTSGTANNPPDYTLTAGENISSITSNSFTIEAGKDTAIINLIPVDDSEIEPNENVQVTLTDGNNYIVTNNNSANLIISDNDASVSFSQADYQVNENSQVIGAAVRIERTGFTNSEASVQVQLSNGSATGGEDFDSTTQIITFGNGETSKIVNIPITDDTLIEGIEDFNLSLVNPSANIIVGNQSTAKLQIIDNDTIPTLTISDVSRAEGNSGVTDFEFVISLNVPTTQTVEVDYTIGEGTATAGSDYTATPPGKIIFNPNEITKTIKVSVNGDNVLESNETFTITLSNPVNATISDNQGIGTIINDDNAPVLTNVSKTGDEDNQITFSAADFISNGNNFSKIKVTSLPNNGTLQLNSSSITVNQEIFLAELANLRFTPAANWNGNTSFNWNGFDGANYANADATVNFTINPVNDAPVVNNSVTNQNATVNSLFNFSFSADTFQDIDSGDSLSYTVTLANGNSLPNWLNFNSTTRTFTGTPTPNDVGTFSILLKATDSANASVNNPFNLTVGNFNPTPTDPTPTNPTPTNPTPTDPTPTNPTPTDPTLPVLLDVDCFCDEIVQPDVNNLPDISVELNSADNIQWHNEGSNFVLGTNSNDEVYGNGGDDWLIGGIGEDNLLGGQGNDVILGGKGRDWLAGNEGDDFVNGNQGDDFVHGNQGNDTVCGGQGNDFVRGGQDNDLLFGDVGNDTLAGDKGNDTVFGGGSDAFGNSDSDLIFGGSGDDLLHGNTGNDTIFGEAGNDTVHGGKDDDIVCGDVGEDVLYGDLGNDSLCGDDGNDTIFGGNGDDSSANDDDEICGGEGNDLLFGNQGADWIYGETGNDTLYGGKGNDTLIGGDGDDLLSGDFGNDSLTGGNGSDQFVLAVGKGSDVITDFQDGVDSFVLAGNLTFQQLSFVQSGNNTLISLTSNNELLATLNGISPNLITQQDFVLLA